MLNWNLDYDLIDRIELAKQKMDQYATFILIFNYKYKPVYRNYIIIYFFCLRTFDTFEDK